MYTQSYTRQSNDMVLQKKNGFTKEDALILRAAPPVYEIHTVCKKKAVCKKKVSMHRTRATAATLVRICVYTK